MYKISSVEEDDRNRKDVERLNGEIGFKSLAAAIAVMELSSISAQVSFFQHSN